MIVNLLLFSISFLYLLYFLGTRNFNYWKVKNVPSLKPFPLFGNYKDVVLRRKPQGIVTQEIYKQFPNEKIVGMYRMTSPCLLIRDLDLIKHIMIKDFDLFTDRGIEFDKDKLGNNLFHADGETWHPLRNKFTPLFTSGKLKNMFYLMAERGDKFIDYVDEICKTKGELEVHGLVQFYTVSTISACAFGLDIDFKDAKMEELKVINDLIFRLSILNEVDMLFPGVLKKISASVFPKVVTNFFYNLVKEISAQRNGVPSGRKDFMDLIFELRQQKEINTLKRNKEETTQLEITDSIIAAQAFVFYAAGFETSATTMSFMLYELARNQDVQDKLIAEIDEVLARNDGKVTYEAIKEMTYMMKVFDETLRMYPLVEPLQRNAKSNYLMPDTDVKIEKGTTVLISPIAIHNDEKYYPNPEKFDPERFSPENARARHPCAYLPFGLGPRNCIGMRFAKVQSQVCIANLLSKFRVAPSKNTKKIMEFDPYKPILNPRGGIYLNVIPRSK